MSERLKHPDYRQSCRICGVRARRLLIVAACGRCRRLMCDTCRRGTLCQVCLAMAESEEPAGVAVVG